VPLARPRSTTDPAFVELKRETLEALRA
jgi:hypothetical protein